MTLVAILVCAQYEFKVLDEKFSIERPMLQSLSFFFEKYLLPKLDADGACDLCCELLQLFYNDSIETL